jgi:hypothetical protein
MPQIKDFSYYRVEQHRPQKKEKLFPISFLSSSSDSLLRATPITFAPAADKTIAARLPRPELAPVTRATLFLKSKSEFILTIGC